jgi:hypothetical protein
MPDTQPLPDDPPPPEMLDDEVVAKFRNKMKIEKETLERRLENIKQREQNSTMPQYNETLQLIPKGANVFYNGMCLGTKKALYKELSIPSK